MARPEYLLLDHTADLGFEVAGPDFTGLCERAVLALADVITPVADLGLSASRTVRREGADDVARLHALLDETLFLFDTERFLPARARVRLEGDAVVAELEGEIVDPDVRPIDRVVKAVTYHEMAVERRGEGLVARVILDL
jgi:SHS2 domain-containing protein